MKRIKEVTSFSVVTVSLTDPAVLVGGASKFPLTSEIVQQGL